MHPLSHRCMHGGRHQPQRYTSPRDHTRLLQHGAAVPWGGDLAHCDLRGSWPVSWPDRWIATAALQFGPCVMPREPLRPRTGCGPGKSDGGRIHSLEDGLWEPMQRIGGVLCRGVL